MSTVLLDQAVAYIRTQFTKAEVVAVQAYGGEFSSAEVGQISYTCPAIFVTVLGWGSEDHGTRFTGKYARKVRMAAFVATKHASREQRLRGAMVLADKLALVLRQWMPAVDNAQPMQVAPLEEDATAENLYGRAMDEKGQALWMLRWEQAVRPNLSAPALVDWLTLQIEDTARATLAATAVTSSTLVVTEKITF